MIPIGSFKRLWRDERGSAAAELVLILPMATLMLMVTLEAGRFMYTQHEVMKSVRDAARYGARQPFSAFNCTAAKAETALPSDGSALGTIRSNVVTLARYGQLDTDAPLRVAGWTAANVEVTYSCLAWANDGLYKQQGFAPRITVVATPNYPTLFGSASGFLSSIKLFARQQAVVMGT